MIAVASTVPVPNRKIWPSRTEPNRNRILRFFTVLVPRFLEPEPNCRTSGLELGREVPKIESANSIKLEPWRVQTPNFVH